MTPRKSGALGFESKGDGGFQGSRGCFDPSENALRRHGRSAHPRGPSTSPRSAATLRMTDLKEQLQAVRTVASARHAGTGCQLQGKAPEGSFRECLAAAWAIGTSSGSFDFAAKRGYAQDGRLKRTAPSCKNKLPVHDTPGQGVSCQ